ncbi:hypothetical protein AAI421_17895 [Rhodococcus aetherivorans]|uniref:hypothetical protein n=1 Tax=Rhodococcus aetherivorans TaxID=191292 RepID=UPI0031DD73DB
MSAPSPDLALATANAAFFASAAKRIRRADDLADQIAAVRLRIAEIDIRNDPDAWHEALEELVELEVKRRSL